VTQGLKTRRLLLPRYWARGPNRREGFHHYLHHHYLRLLQKEMKNDNTHCRMLTQ